MDAPDEVVFGAGVLRLRLARRVSWTPGAEGAPMLACEWEGLLEEGTMRRDMAPVF